MASDDARLADPRRLQLLKDWLGLPLVALLAGLLAVLLAWAALRAADRERTRAAAEGLARSAAADVERTLLDYERIFADVRARRGAALAQDSGWRLELVGLHAAGWADASGILTWATPSGRDHLRGLRLGGDARARAALDESLRTGRSRFAGPALSDVAGGPYVLLLVPVGSGERPLGHLVGFFEARQLIATALRQASTLGSIAVLDGERVLARVGSARDGGLAGPGGGRRPGRLLDGAGPPRQRAGARRRAAPRLRAGRGRPDRRAAGDGARLFPDRAAARTPGGRRRGAVPRAVRGQPASDVGLRAREPALPVRERRGGRALRLLARGVPRHDDRRHPAARGSPAALLASVERSSAGIERRRRLAPPPPRRHPHRSRRRRRTT